MRTALKITAILITGLTIVGCVKESQNVIEAELLDYIDAFETEALARNIDIDISNIDINGYIESIETRGTLGQCKSYSDGSKDVVFDQEYWDRISYSEREYLVFHELGHCILNRDHEDSSGPTGNCISIMQSGNGGCNSTYDSENRQLLIDELFEI